jgi:hypothetical protein
VIVTLAFSFTSAVDVAVMLAVPAATAVTRPVPSTVATFAALEDQVAALFADNWTFAPTDTAVTGAPEMVSGLAGGVTETSSPQAASPARPPIAINERKSFCILFPLLECEIFLHVRQKLGYNFLEFAAFRGQVLHLLPTEVPPSKNAMRPLSMTKDPTTS